ncbi:hypothetical protein PVAG01_03329 [Phlyctema vagabunda]|uniref:RNA ligase/cyclic nucleotide phosphodiesterase n=1 Tax=Phlyctema vagabunda TaxID=108571 RepID=A0ABR4PL48_9HELO
MASSSFKTADSQNKYEDLSGINTAAYANPYDALIEACHDDPKEIQTRYHTHRSTRNAQQKTSLTSPDFAGVIIDPILARLEDPTIEPGYIDPRNCLVFWARPPQHIKDVVAGIQTKLKSFAPNLWVMPVPNLHLTALEITHSLTNPEIQALIHDLGDEVIATMTDYTHGHRSRLIKPTLSWDGAAVALSFVPAAGEFLHAGRTIDDDKYTYHHLRRDLFSIATQGSVKINSRYVVPSSHITLGRFVTQEDHHGPEKMQRWIELLEAINEDLQKKVWETPQGEWIVGQEKGLVCREGTLWYGGGTEIRAGKGF